MAEVKCKIIEECGVLGEDKGMEIKLTYTSWGDNSPKYDLRGWYKNGKGGKGITFTTDEVMALYETLKDVFENGKAKETEVVVETPKPKTKAKEPECNNTNINALLAGLNGYFGNDERFKVYKHYGTYRFAPSQGKRLSYQVIGKITKSAEDMIQTFTEMFSGRLDITTFKTVDGIYVDAKESEA